MGGREVCCASRDEPWYVWWNVVGHPTGQKQAETEPMMNGEIASRLRYKQSTNPAICVFRVEEEWDRVVESRDFSFGCLAVSCFGRAFH
jgi:hypothetical protein